MTSTVERRSVAVSCVWTTATPRNLPRTYEHSWSSSETVEDEWTIPARKVGYTYAYNAASSSKGNAVFKGYLFGWDYVGEERKPLSALVPGEHEYNYKHVTADS